MNDNIKQLSKAFLREKNPKAITITTVVLSEVVPSPWYYKICILCLIPTTEVQPWQKVFETRTIKEEQLRNNKYMFNEYRNYAEKNIIEKILMSPNCKQLPLMAMKYAQEFQAHGRPLVFLVTNGTPSFLTMVIKA